MISRRDATILAATVAFVTLPVVAAVAIGQMGGTVVVENKTQGARIDGVRWISPDGQDVVYGAGSLLPGDAVSLHMGLGNTDVAGTLRFELEVDGSRVLLDAKRSVRVSRGARLKVTIDPAFEVRHTLASATPL